MTDRTEAGARRSRRATWALALGAALGVVLAAVGVVGPSAELGLGSRTIARVNGTAITADAYERAVGSLAADKRNPLTPEDRAHILERLIEEELLIQRGVEIGLVASDRGVRAAIAAAMIDSILAEVASSEASERELRVFYAENRNYFAKPARIRVQRSLFRGADAEVRAGEAHAALVSGAAFEAVRAQLGDQDMSPAPDTLLPPAKLRDYLGPTLVQVATQLRPGEFSAPVRTSAGYSIVRLVELSEAQTPDFERVRDQVEAEFQRRAGDRQLRDYLDELRLDADIRLAPFAPKLKAD